VLVDKLVQNLDSERENKRADVVPGHAARPRRRNGGLLAGHHTGTVRTRKRRRKRRPGGQFTASEARFPSLVPCWSRAGSNPDVLQQRQPGLGQLPRQRTRD